MIILLIISVTTSAAHRSAMPPFAYTQPLILYVPDESESLEVAVAEVDISPEVAAVEVAVAEVEISPEVKDLRSELSQILYSSNKIGEKITPGLDEFALTGGSFTSVFSPKVWGKKTWLNINVEQVISEHLPPDSRRKKVVVNFESSSRLSDEVRNELGEYSVALYKLGGSGNDSVSLPVSFKEMSFYGFSALLDPSKVRVVSSKNDEDIRSKVYGTYIGPDAKPGTYFLLLFRNNDLLINSIV